MQKPADSTGVENIWSVVKMRKYLCHIAACKLYKVQDTEYMVEKTDHMAPYVGPI